MIRKFNSYVLILNRNLNKIIYIAFYSSDQLIPSSYNRLFQVSGLVPSLFIRKGSNIWFTVYLFSNPRLTQDAM